MQGVAQLSAVARKDLGSAREGAFAPQQQNTNVPSPFVNITFFLACIQRVNRADSS
jgi:hypothetical protein